MADVLLGVDEFEKAVLNVCSLFNVEKLFPQQEKALFQFLSRRDVYVNLPTGYGKSMIFQMAPLVASELSNSNHYHFSQESIIIVISPLVALMKDQVSFLNTHNIPAAFVTADQEEGVLKEVEAGKFRGVYTSPESMLSVDRWRRMLSSKTYMERLIGIAVDEAHCISHWGFSGNKGKVAFRQWYSCLRELRSLVPSGLPFMALTATASKNTRKDVFQVLELLSPFEVVESPDRRNITYSTQLLEKGKDIVDYFGWLVEEIKGKGANSERVLIYCQTVKQCTQLYQVFASELSKSMFVDHSLNPRQRLVEMLHSKTPASVKDTILDSFSKEYGHVRVLFATIAFGMGINAKGLKTVIHVGPSKNVEAYVQESGRCGRGGEQSRAIVLFNNKMCVFCDKGIKDYLLSEECRRKVLRQPFDSGSIIYTSPEMLHNCCDNCAKKCECDQAECQSSLFLPASSACEESPLAKKRDVSLIQKELLQVKLQAMRKSLVMKAMQGDQKGRKATVISCPSFLLEFTDVQIKQVLDNSEFISSIADVMLCVEVWQYKHAEAIYELFYEVFQDVPAPSPGSEDSEDSDDEDELLNEWADLIEDDSFQQMLNSGLFSDSFQVSGLIPDTEEEAHQANYPSVLDSVLQNVVMHE